MSKKILSNKSVTQIRDFALNIDLKYQGNNKLEQYAQEVIECIEKDVFAVARPDNKDLLLAWYEWHENCVAYIYGKNLPFEPDKLRSMTVDVSLREWLPVGCQGIRWDSDAELTYTCYENNADDVLWRKVGKTGSKLSPLAFVGEIRIGRELRQDVSEYDTPPYNDYFKLIIAHELARVFDYMRFIVPAFMDWPAFRRNYGLSCGVGEIFSDFYDGHLINRCTGKEELARLQEY